jgi:Uma2 family endonuclease
MASAGVRATEPGEETTQGESPVEEGRILLLDIRWETYEALLRDFERGGSKVRMTYDRGRLELMSPAPKHERRKKRLAQMIELVLLELNIDHEPGGSSTLRNSLKERGLEADECYWIAHEGAVRERDEIDLRIDPPPDLAVEIENTTNILDRLPVYAALGFPEVWREAGETLTIGLLQPDGTYRWGEASGCFPFLNVAEFARFLVRVPGEGHKAWLRRFLDWVRAELVPHHARPEGG